MSNSLFVYGTLMFSEITFKLLEHTVDARPAILKNYARASLVKRGSKAKGPAIFPDSTQMVEGVLLSNLTPRDLNIIHCYEEEARGYQICAVQVELSDGLMVQTQTYELEESFRENISGEWSKDDFAKNHLNYYLNERIPQFLTKWRYNKIENEKKEEE